MDSATLKLKQIIKIFNMIQGVWVMIIELIIDNDKPIRHLKVLISIEIQLYCCSIN